MARRYTIWDELRRMQDEMDRLFEAFFRNEPIGWGGSTPLLAGPNSSAAVQTSDYRQPLADMWETDDEVITTVELPGVDKQDIKINATEDGIEVKVEKKDERKEEDKKKGRYRLERSYSGFYRYIALPENIDPNKINASYKNGVLELRMPKVEKEKRKGREIKVN